MNDIHTLAGNLSSLFGQVFGIAMAILIPIGIYLYFRGKVAVKMGDPFTLGCIPYANDYCWFQKLWPNPDRFWLYAACCFGSCYIPIIGSLVMVPIQLVMRTKLYWRLGKAFNKTPLFCLGLVILTPVFLGIIAFDRSVFTPPAYACQFNGINYGRLNTSRTKSLDKDTIMDILLFSSFFR